MDLTNGYWYKYKKTLDESDLQFDYHFPEGL
jgi:hypothetical protein